MEIETIKELLWYVVFSLGLYLVSDFLAYCFDAGRRERAEKAFDILKDL